MTRFIRRLVVASAVLGAITGIASAALDQDTDGMSDLWEEKFGFSKTSSNLPGQGPSQDPDGDGVSNQLESIAGTNPLSNAPSHGMFRITTAANPVDPLRTHLQWPTFWGKNYQVLSSTDLVTTSWSAVASSFTATSSGLFSYTTAPRSPAEPRKFFKISVKDEDPDADGLTTSEETILGTNPYLTDTDTDGANDKVEVIQSSSPTDPTDNGLPPIAPALLPLKVKIFTYASLGGTYPSSDGLLTPYTIKIFEQTISSGIEAQVYQTTYDGSLLVLNATTTLPNISNNPDKRYTVQIDLPTIGTTMFDRPFADWSFFINISANTGSTGFFAVNGFEPISQIYGSPGHILRRLNIFNPLYESYRAVLAPIDVKEVTFQGNQTVKKDDGTGDYTGSDWTDKNYDRDTNGVGENQWPICYVKGDTLKVTAKFKATIPSSVGATIRARIATNSPAVAAAAITFGPSSILTSVNGIIDCPLITASVPIDGTKTNYLAGMELTWEMNQDGSTLWNEIGKTSHPFYSLFGQPIQTEKLYHTVLHLACSNPGATTWNQVVDKASQNFAGPANVKAWNPVSRSFVRPLYYYKVGIPQSQCDTAVLPFLQSGNGQCLAWASLFLDCLKIHGESTSQSVQVNGGGDDGDFLLVIKNWQAVQGGPNPPHIRLPTAEPDLSCSSGNVQYGDLTSVGGLSGQNTITPYVKIFGGHAIAKYNGIYYDPSYGITYTGIQDFEDKAIVGYGVNDLELARKYIDPADIRTESANFSSPIFGELDYPGQ